MPPAAAIAALRRVAAAIDDGRPQAPEDNATIATALRLYLADAHAGMTLDRAFNVATMQGSPPWWEAERLATRDAAIRAAAARLAGGALQLDAELRRYEATDWRRDRRLDQLPAEHADSLRALLFQICRSGKVPKLRRLRQIAG